MQFKRPESVLVVLYDEHYRVLVLQRKDDPEFWQSVTGSIEAGESPLDTAYREVEEETGIRLSAEDVVLRDCQRTNQYVIRPCWRYRYPPNTIYNTEHVFSAQIKADSPLVLTEHLSYKWLPKQEALAKLWSPSNREAVEAFVPEVDKW